MENKAKIDNFTDRYSKATGLSNQYINTSLRKDFDKRNSRKSYYNKIFRNIKIYFNKLWKYYMKIMFN